MRAMLNKDMTKFIENHVNNYEKIYSEDSILSTKLLEEKEIIQDNEPYIYQKQEVTYKNGDIVIETNVRKKETKKE